jgi:hypothetical protein
MLISMPTGTSAIFGVFQIIRGLPFGTTVRAIIQPRATPQAAQARKIEARTGALDVAAEISLADKASSLLGKALQFAGFGWPRKYRSIRALLEPYSEGPFSEAIMQRARRQARDETAAPCLPACSYELISDEGPAAVSVVGSGCRCNPAKPLTPPLKPMICAPSFAFQSGQSGTTPPAARRLQASDRGPRGRKKTPHWVGGPGAFSIPALGPFVGR